MIITRIARMFSADVHQILDCLEDPEAVLKHSIREMEKLLDQKKIRQKEILRTEKLLCQRNEKKREAIQAAAQQIDLSLQEDNERLARSFVRRKLELEKMANALLEHQEQAHSERMALETETAEQQLLLDEILAKLEVYQHGQNRAPEGPGHPTTEISNRITEEEVELAFLKAKKAWCVKQRGGVQ